VKYWWHHAIVWVLAYAAAIACATAVSCHSQPPCGEPTVPVRDMTPAEQELFGPYVSGVCVDRALILVNPTSTIPRADIIAHEQCHVMGWRHLP